MKKILLAGTLMLATLGTANAGLLEAFVPTDVDGFNDDSGAMITVEYGEWATDNGISFGWYLTDTGDNSVVDSMNIFGGSDGWLSTSNIAWDFSSNTATASNGNMLDWNGLQSDWELGASFSYNGDTIYSHDALNGGLDLVDLTPTSGFFDMHMGFSDSEQVNTWFGSWDVAFGQIVSVSDVTAWDNSVTTFGTPVDVPEPTGLALFGLAALGAGVMRKKKQRVTSV